MVIPEARTSLGVVTENMLQLRPLRKLTELEQRPIVDEVIEDDAPLEYEERAEGVLERDVEEEGVEEDLEENSESSSANDIEENFEDSDDDDEDIFPRHQALSSGPLLSSEIMCCALRQSIGPPGNWIEDAHFVRLRESAAGRRRLCFPECACERAYGRKCLCELNGDKFCSDECRCDPNKCRARRK